MISFYTLTASWLLFSTALAFPTISRNVSQKAIGAAKIAKDFPDPSIMQDSDGTWYAFATAGNGFNVQIATSSKSNGPGGPWTWLSRDALPKTGNWTTGKNTWAPDVRRMDNGSYVMYYSGEVASNSSHHCVGTATSNTVMGPYTPSAKPFACNLNIGGAIDPSGFKDSNGIRYVVYKVDGNSIGHGGSCGNGNAPQVATPIILQQVAADGITPVGSGVTILDRTDADGPLVEAPAIVKKNGLYVLFFSSGCFTEPTYNVNYATATNISGPYKRASSPLVRTDDAFGLTAPGGATPIVDGSQAGNGIVFHADCAEGRCFFESQIDIDGTLVLLNGADGIGS